MERVGAIYFEACDPVGLGLDNIAFDVENPGDMVGGPGVALDLKMSKILDGEAV